MCLVTESSVRAFYNQFVLLGILYASDNLCVNTETFAYGDNLFGMFGLDIYLKSVTHVEYLVHLGPIGTALLLYCLEKWRNGEEVVFYNSFVLHEMHYFGLSTA